LVAARGAIIRKVIRGSVAVFVVALIFATPSWAQTSGSDATRLSGAQRAFQAQQWVEAAQFAAGDANQPADLDFLRGLALARLSRWNEAKEALEAGRKKAPADPRFPTELAGVAYKQHDFPEAKRQLYAALRLNPHDSYLNEFLGTIYFLEGNLEAALDRWNRIGKPRLDVLTLVPEPRLRAEVRERAITFHPPQVLTATEWRRTEANLQMLEVFPSVRLGLNPAENDTYAAQLRLAEKDGFGSGWLEALLSTFSGAAYSTVYPEYYNIGGAAVNFTSLARWDAQKRRFGGMLSSPVWDRPSQRFEIYFDTRDENWNLSQTFFAPRVSLSGLNVRRFSGGAQLHSAPSGNWSWNAGFDVTRRDFRNVPSNLTATEADFFRNSWSLSGDFGAQRWLLRIPESRFTVEGSAEARAGRYFFHSDQGSRAFGTLRGGLVAHWFPRATGDDYEMTARFRLGGTAGFAPLDELFQLGVERDNDLWLRGHAGTTEGRKGRAPLGRKYALANWELDKTIYNNGVFHVKLGPFLDSGTIADSSGLFGSGGWQWDTGAQMKIKVLGSVTVVLIYGRDLRGGHNVFFPTALH
jgi:tetratricopeptide (TPR) repeat protein